MLPLLMLLASPLRPARAEAQEDEATRTAAARALFESGLAEVDAERWDVAASEFRRALALRPSSIIRLNLAIALGHLGRVVEASELLRGVLRDPSVPEDARANASVTLEALEPRIAWVRLHFSGDRSDAEVRIDGHPISWALADAPIPQDSGPHVVAVHIVGRDPLSQRVVLAPGSTREVTLRSSVATVPDTGDRSAPAWDISAAPVAAVERESGPDPWLVGLGTAGGVVVLAGTLTIVLVLALPSEATPIAGDLGVIEVGR
jgi:hypothetical protein